MAYSAGAVEAHGEVRLDLLVGAEAFLVVRRTEELSGLGVGQT